MPFMSSGASTARTRMPQGSLTRNLTENVHERLILANNKSCPKGEHPPHFPHPQSRWVLRMSKPAACRTVANCDDQKVRFARREGRARRTWTFAIDLT